MIANHLRIALRYIFRNRGYAAITLVGLSVGIASFLLIGLWAADELAYDRFHPKAERIHRVLWDAKYGDNEWRIPLIPIPVADELRKFSEVESVVRFARSARGVRREGLIVREEEFIYAEPAFTAVFDVRPLAGDPAAALSSPGSIVLTEATAVKYFGTREVMGRRLEMSDGTSLQVGAVVEGFPPQSHFHFSMLAGLESYPLYDYRRSNWGSATVYTYFLLREGASVSALESRFGELTGRLLRGDGSEDGGGDGGNRNGFPFQNMLDIHLRSDLQYELEPGGNAGTVRLLTAVGGFILLLACVNFINLSTARASQRASEVGIRKTLGSSKLQLLLQFLSESGILVTGATLTAVLMVELSLPRLSELSGKTLELRYAEPATPLLLAGIAAAVTLIAGAYPALVLSSFAPIPAMKGKTGDGRSGAMLRNVLVVFQFAICIGLMAGMATVYGQLRYLLGRDLGFDRERVVVLRGAGALRGKLDAFLHELETGGHVAAAAPAQALPGYGFDSQLFEPEQPSNYRQTSLTYAMIDHRFADALRLRFAEGRNFSPSLAGDSSAFLINRSAAAALGWKQPVGKKLRYGNVEGPVIGVVEDFNYESLRSGIKPIVFPFMRWAPTMIAVRLRESDPRGHVEAVAAAWSKFLPDRPVDYTFLDDDYGRLYRNESRLSAVFTLFTAIALVIACLGLYGLSAHTVQRRIKEIGIRKVLGASATGIVGLLSGQFLRPVIVSTVVASPVAWFLLDDWLDGFAYRIPLGPLPFVAVGLTAVVLALVTVAAQSLRAARANPVESLRYE